MVITSNDLGEIILNKSQSSILKETSLGLCNIDIYSDTDFRIFSGDFCFKEDVTVNVKNDSSEVVMFNNISGNRITNYKDFKGDITLKQNEHNLLYSNQNENQLFFPKNVNHKSLVVYFNPKNFIELTLGFENYYSDNFLDKISNKKSTIVKKQNMNLSPEMFALAIKLKKELALKKNSLFIKAAVYNLLGLQIESISMDTNSIKINNTDKNKIQVARDLLLKKENSNITLDELAMSIGMNITKFKQLFKSIYGKPVKSYQSYYKMEEAQKYLLEGNHTVAEIGYLIGYDYPEHFSRGFKKHFGYSPSSIRK